MNRNNLLGAICCGVLFALGVAGAAYFHEKSASIAIVCVIGGIALGCLCLIAITGQKSKGRMTIDVKNQRAELQWKLRQAEPLDTISPPSTTDSTDKIDAVAYCEKGREILRGHGDLDEAYRYFSDASTSDDSYWEPRANMAGIHVIKGELDQAFRMAEELRDFSISTNNNLAFSNASLIMASVVETSIDPDLAPDMKEKEYRKVVSILDEALNRSPYDVVVRSAKIKAQIVGEFEREDIINEILSSHDNEAFRDEFATVLDSDEELKTAFVDELPEMVALVFPSRTT